MFVVLFQQLFRMWNNQVIKYDMIRHLLLYTSVISATFFVKFFFCEVSCLSVYLQEQCHYPLVVFMNGNGISFIIKTKSDDLYL